MALISSQSELKEKEEHELRDTTLLIWILFDTIHIKQVITGILPTQFNMVRINFKRYLRCKNFTNEFLFAAADLLTQKMRYIYKLMDTNGNIEKLSLKRILPEFRMNYSTGFYQIEEEYGDVVQVDCLNNNEIVQSLDYQIPWQITCKIEDEWTAQMIRLNKGLPRPTQELGFLDEIASFFFWSEAQMDSMASGLQQMDTEEAEEEEEEEEQRKEQEEKKQEKEEPQQEKETQDMTTSPECAPSPPSKAPSAASTPNYVYSAQRVLDFSIS